MSELESSHTNYRLSCSAGKGKGTQIRGAVAEAALGVWGTTEVVIATGDQLAAVIVYGIVCPSS